MKLIKLLLLITLLTFIVGCDMGNYFQDDRLEMLQEQQGLMEKASIYLDSTLTAQKNGDCLLAFAYLVEAADNTKDAHDVLWEYYREN